MARKRLGALAETPEPEQLVGLIRVPVEAERAEAFVGLRDQGLVAAHDSERSERKWFRVLPRAEQRCGLLLGSFLISQRRERVQPRNPRDKAEPTLVPTAC